MMSAKHHDYIIKELRSYCFSIVDLTNLRTYVGNFRNKVIFGTDDNGEKPLTRAAIRDHSRASHCTQSFI
jgi:hypothetical protein